MRPAITACFIASAIATGSLACAMPVLEITASQPNSIAIAALKLAEAAKVDGTPTFIIDGQVRPGPVDDKESKELTKGHDKRG